MNRPVASLFERALVVTSWKIIGIVLLSSCSSQPELPRRSEHGAAKHNVVENRPSGVASALGILQPTSEIVELAPPTDGMLSVPRVQKLLVKEGQQVKVGEPLVIFDSFDKTQADLRKSRIEMQGLERQRKILLTKTMRFESLKRQGAFPASELEDMQLKLEELMTKRMSAEEAHAKMLNLAKDSILKSPLTGTVLRIHTRPGERASDRQPVLEVGDTRELQVTAEVDESLTSKIYPGQKVGVTSSNKAFAGTYYGKVVEIQPMVSRRTNLPLESFSDPDRDARVVQVKISLLKSALHSLKNYSGAKVRVIFEK